MNFYGKPMADRYEQVHLFSPAEYKRRYDGIRKIMKDRDIQVCIFLECAEEAYDHWLTGRRMLEYLIIPESGEAVAVLYGELDESRCPLMNGVDYGRYVMQKPLLPVCDGLRVVNRLSDENIADILAASNPRRIGLVLPEQMNRGLFAAIEEKVPNAERIDISVPVALFRAVKSGEEIAAMLAARDIQAAVLGAVPQLLRPGRSLAGINNEVRRLLMNMGSSGVFNCGLQCYGRQDEPAAGGPPGSGEEHIMQRGERYKFLMEATGPGHQHIAFGRWFVLGEPMRCFTEHLEKAVKVHQFAVSQMKPGETTLAQIAVKTRKYANSLGAELMEKVGWNWMHSMGAFFYEQLSLEDYTEDEALPENIVLHCHPMIYRYFPDRGNAREGLYLLNTYLITKDGAQDLSGIPFELVVLD